MMLTAANRSRLGCLTVTALALSLCVKVSAQQQQCTENKALRKDNTNATAVKKSQFTAIVVGGTGATGRQVVKELLHSDKWSSVTVLTRYPPKAFTGYIDDDRAIESAREAKEKLTEKTVGDWSVDKIDMPQADAIFLCLGTTLWQAGSPEALEKIEVQYTAKAAIYAKKAGVKHGAVVSSLGADSATYVPSIYLHPLFYLRTMGRKQQAVVDVGFPSASIWKPGMLNRLTGDRYWENVMNYLGFGLRTDVLARAMVRDAEKKLLALQEDTIKKEEENTKNKGIKKGKQGKGEARQPTFEVITGNPAIEIRAAEE